MAEKKASSKRTSKPAGETADATPSTSETASSDVDRVAMPSLKADGSADQTPGYEVIVDEDEVERQGAPTPGA